jgi:reactive intermediate/imine deaminase
VYINCLLDFVKMVSITSIFTTVLVVAGIASAKPVPKSAEVPVVTYLGTQGPILSSGAWTSKGIVYTSGTVPTFNGSIITGGIEEQTVCHVLENEHSPPGSIFRNSMNTADRTQAQVIKNIGAVLEEAGTSWDCVMKTTVFLANMSDYTAMNAVYGAMLPSPKPARTAVEVGKLPGNFLIEIEAIAAIPDS